MLKKGSKVRWTSQSNGYETIKEGKIVAVVPAGGIMTDYVPKGYRAMPGSGKFRDHRSYLVFVKRPQLYWPRVKDLVEIDG